jgi:hypothetical protein
MRQVLRQSLRFLLMFITCVFSFTGTVSSPVQASSCACTYIHTNTSTGYTSYLNTDTSLGFVGYTNNLLFATVNGSAAAPVDDHALGFWYAQAGPFQVGSGGWTVFNEDLTSIAAQTRFTIFGTNPVQDSTYASYTHIATAANSANNFTYLDNPNLNNHPDATLNVSAAYVPNHAVYDTHPLGVWYSWIAQKWAIIHEDGTPIPTNAAYFVLALSNNDYNLFKSTVVAPPSTLYPGQVIIDNAQLNNDPHAEIQLTQDEYPHTVSNPHNVGVKYDISRGKWLIYNLDGTAIPPNAAFFLSWIY